jgi:heptosyltransferase I
LNILIVKLSSLGDVVHTMPAVQDIRRALPHAQIDWVVEPAFAPLVQRCAGVHRVVPCALRAWRKSWWTAATRAAWRAFKGNLAQVQYDAVIDCQGLTKSAIIARCAQLASGGKRYAMANGTDGSGYEAATRWLADVAIDMPQHVHAVQRSRLLCAQALSYSIENPLKDKKNQSFGLVVHAFTAQAATKSIADGTVAFIHGTSRADKCWSEVRWVQLGQRLIAQGYSISLVHGSDAEEQCCQRIAAALGGVAQGGAAQGGSVQVWPRMPLDALTDQLAQCAGVIGVDSGLSHIAVALDVPHVQLYNFDTAWRTGPQGLPRQISVFAQPEPSVEQVWQAWLQVAPSANTVSPLAS